MYCCLDLVKPANYNPATWELLRRYARACFPDDDGIESSATVSERLGRNGCIQQYTPIAMICITDSSLTQV